jgi:iron complex transport system ATP-binding protein
MLIEVDGVRCAYDGVTVLDDVTLRIEPRDVVGILGPNGAGKSTLLRAMSRVLRPRAGRALLEGRDLYGEVSATESARAIGVVPQEGAPAFDFTVHEAVLMGRSPHLRRFQSESARDLEIVRHAMERTETWELRDRPVTELSGGERQRVILARAFAQEPRVLLLDEPTAHLDLGHQIQTMRMVAELGCAVVAVMHDLNLAAAFCRRLIVLDRGRIAAAGDASQVLTAGMIERVFRIRVEIVAREGRLTILPRLP